MTATKYAARIQVWAALALLAYVAAATVYDSALPGSGAAPLPTWVVEAALLGAGALGLPRPSERLAMLRGAVEDLRDDSGGREAPSRVDTEPGEGVEGRDFEIVPGPGGRSVVRVKGAPGDLS